ncbi:hypothetical protein SAMN05660662_0158 [Blastococcus aurantiacus]|uniref:DUF4386 family protein n=1 Tax=Blastococcus aurantiacus TaxID=1550231 RepID=A0A1G7R355_9ACTN|nr:hypothetical protein [Blastococcus aurantiacus]SDG05158.1 hypothetical protein SAMN05660662_0158 [Blastococcus aurantiacus]
MTITTSALTRGAGVSAVLSGLLFILIQPIHPPENVAAVTGTAWVVIALMTIAMAVLGLAGLTGIYFRQVRESGPLGLLGYVMLGGFYLVTTAWTFVEAFVLPQIADDAPRFVDDFLGVPAGVSPQGDVGSLPLLFTAVSVLYLVGGLVFGIAVYRARILQRGAAALLAVGTVLSLAAAVLPHSVGRYAAVPVGLAMVWLGWSLWSEQRTPAAPSAAQPHNSPGASVPTR